MTQIGNEMQLNDDSDRNSWSDISECNDDVGVVAVPVTAELLSPFVATIAIINVYTVTTTT